MGEAANGAGTSSPGPNGRPDVLGVQSTKLGRSIKSFDDACVAFLSFFTLPITYACMGFLHTIGAAWICKMNACPNLTRTLRP